MENDTPNKQKDWLLPASILVAGIIIAGSVIYSTGLKNYKPKDSNVGEEQNQQSTSTAQNLNQKNYLSSNDVILGDANASVTIIEFGDFQCPFCAKFFHDTQSQIVDNYIKTGKAKMVYKALAFLGSESDSAALAALCAKEQGKFWQFHDAIFEAEWNEVEKVMAGKLMSNENNGNLSKDFFTVTAQNLGMNEDDFLFCFDSKKYQSEIDANSAQANSALNGKVSTPSFLINGIVLQGALPFSNFQTVIEAALKK